MVRFLPPGVGLGLHATDARRMRERCTARSFLEDIDPLCLRIVGRRGRPIRRSGAEEAAVMVRIH
jgi:hypothetical protein